MIEKINNIEDLITIRINENDKIKFEVEPDTIIRYIYFNKHSSNLKINIDELRKVYAKSVNRLYEKKQYTGNIIINQNDIKKICLKNMIM